ncbi:MAG: beta strand repeat-containing protein, partial [Chloroflexota bacterium]
QRDLLVDHLSGLVNTTDVKNPDGTDTIQMNGRFQVDGGQSYRLTTLTDASSSAGIKPVKVFWQQDVTKFENVHPGYDPITGKNLTTGVPLPSTAQPPLSVPPADISTGSLQGAMEIRDQVIQGTLIPQLNELADSLTNTQSLSSNTGLTAGQQLSGKDSFTVSVLTPQGAPTNPPGPGQTITFDPSSLVPPPTTVQGVIDAINGSNLSPYVHASLNAAGQLQIDTTLPGALVKVQAGVDGTASKDFGFSQSVADGFNLVHVRGYGLDTPAQFVGGVSGLTLSSPLTAGDGLTIQGPDGSTINVTIPPPASPALSIVVPTSTAGPFAVNQQPLLSSAQIAVSIAGNTTAGTVTVTGTDSTGAPLIQTVTFGANANGTLLTPGAFKTVTGVSTTVTGGTLAVAPANQNSVQDLITAINAAGLSHGFQAALDPAGHVTVFSEPSSYGSSGQLIGTAAQIVGESSSPVALTSTFSGGDKITIAGPTGPAVTLSTTSGETVSQFIQQINDANIGLVASINGIGQFQIASQATGSSQDVSLTPVTVSNNDLTGLLGLPSTATTVKGLDGGYPPSAIVKVTGTLGNAVADFYGSAGNPPTTNLSNTNQFFFQGARQILPGGLLVPSAISGSPLSTTSQPQSPSQIAVTLLGATGFTAPTNTITVNGLDANGNTLSDILTFTGNGVLTTPAYFKTVTSVVAGAGLTPTTATLSVAAVQGNTQADTAASIAVDASILKDPTLIATSSVPGAPGNDVNALALLNVEQTTTISDGAQAATLGDFYSSVITNLGGAAATTHTTMLTQQQLVQHLQNQKQSIVGVSVDQEAADLVALQHAYEAAARAITTQDLMLTTIITGMGLIGR